MGWWSNYMTSKHKKTNSLLEVFVEYQSTLKRLVKGIVPQGDVEDIVQETFIRAHQAEVDKCLEYPKTFMYKTARNLALNFIARKEYTNTSGIEETPELNVYISSQHQLSDVESKEKFHLFCAAVRDLPLQCRRAFIMKRVFGYSIKEISKELGISESTTEKHIAKGVLRCADFLKERGYEVTKRAKHKQKRSSK